MTLRGPGADAPHPVRAIRHDPGRGRDGRYRARRRRAAAVARARRSIVKTN